MTHAGITTMTRYFGKDRGKAISLGNLGGMIGVMFLPVLVVFLKNHFTFREIWLFSSISLIIFLPILFFILNNQNERQKKFKESIEGNFKQWKTIEVIRNKNFLNISTNNNRFLICRNWSNVSSNFYFFSKRLDFRNVGNWLYFFRFFSIIGLLLGGPLIDILNPRKTILFLLLPIFIAIIILIFFNSYFFLLIYMSLYGFNLGISSPFTGSLWAEIFGLESLGTVKALFHAIVVLASALSPVIFGYIIDWGFGIGMISFISLFMIILATILPFTININEQSNT